MKIRLISGKFGKRILDAPDGAITHPMSERVRGALFNIIRSKLDGAIVLDVFAGSGAVGLEAVSCGASHVTFVDKDPMAVSCLNENIKKLGVESTTLVVSSDVLTWAKGVNDKVFDIIFIDPPYDNMQFSTINEVVTLLKIKGLMVLSYPGKGEVPQFNEFVVVDNRSYGNAALAFYQRK